MTANSYAEGNPGNNLYIFDFCRHQGFSCAQPIEVSFNFRPVFPAATNLIGCALLLTKKLMSVSSYVHRQFDLV